MNLHQNPMPRRLINAHKRILIANIFLIRRQHQMPRSWSVVVGFLMNTLAVHTQLGMQLFIALAVLERFSREEIALGLYFFLNHDLEEIPSADKNVYSAPYLKIDGEGAMRMIQKGHPFADENLAAFHDYELGKKGQHTDTIINAVGKLLKDTDGLEAVWEQLEKAARGQYAERRWRRPEVQAENDYKRNNYNYLASIWVHNTLIERDFHLFVPLTEEERARNPYAAAVEAIVERRRDQYKNPRPVHGRYNFTGPRQSKALQCYYRMQVFLLLGQLSGLSVRHIGEGLLRLMGPASYGLEPYSKDLQGTPTDMLINDLVDDACLLEEVIEHLEYAASTPSEEASWTNALNKMQRQKVHGIYAHEVSRQLHEAIEDYGLDAYDDAFLRLPNTMKNGTHGK